jgi:phospholipid-translocating ATPase
MADTIDDVKTGQHAISEARVHTDVHGASSARISVQQRRALTGVFLRVLSDTWRTVSKSERSPEAVRANGERHIRVNLRNESPFIGPRTQTPYCDNSIHSNRFTIWNFLPWQIYIQFSKFANFYFLCVSIIQLLPSVSTTGRYTTLIPLLIFVGISMLREGIDDIRRSRQDHEENHRKTCVLTAVSSPGPETASEIMGTSSSSDISWRGKVPLDRLPTTF